MITDRHKLACMLTIFIIISTAVLCEENKIQLEGLENNPNKGYPEARALFSPRVDYNEWLPVGRGDPLKNDPTYDYSPPVLDRVHYWGDSNKDKKDVLLLGVTSKRQPFKKETKHTAMRRNFYSHLPTRLMPPPMQTISPSVKHSTAEINHGMYNSNRYNGPNWSHNSITYGDSSPEESINYVSISRPNFISINKPSSASKPVQMQSESSQYMMPQRKPWLHSLLEKEVSKPSVDYVSKPSVEYVSKSNTDYVLQSSQSVFESHTSVEPGSTLFTTTTEDTPHFLPTIPSTGMTTDSLFSHYKQPMEPIQGPMYLIIEGHSKVKTYGLKDNKTKRVHAPKIVPIAKTEDAVIKHVVSHDDDGKILEVQHLHKTPAETTTSPSSTLEPTGMDDLKTKSKIPERESRQVFDYDDLPETALRDKDGYKIIVEPKNNHDVTIDSDLSPTEIATEWTTSLKDNIKITPELINPKI